MRQPALLMLAPLLIANAGDPELPAPLKAMLDAAMASGSEGDVAVIVKYARTAWPDHADTAAKIAGDWRAERQRVAERKLRESDFFALMKGRAEFGAYLQDGNSRNAGLTGVLDLGREGYRWRQKLRLQGDYQRSLGVTTRERYLVAYEPNYKLGDRGYVYGAAQFENDRFSGFDQRYSLSAGAGYSAIKDADMTLNLELGPAVRHTRFVDRTRETDLAARGSMDFSWKVNDSITVRQDASAYWLQEANSTLSSKTALLARVVGPLSAQLSYTLQHETMPPEGRVKTDTTSRAALVFDF